MSARKEGYRLRKEQGKCYRCFARDPEPGTRRCWYCADRQREYNRMYERKNRTKR